MFCRFTIDRSAIRWSGCDMAAAGWALPGTCLPAAAAAATAAAAGMGSLDRRPQEGKVRSCERRPSRAPNSIYEVYVGPLQPVGMCTRLSKLNGRDH